MGLLDGLFGGILGGKTPKMPTAQKRLLGAQAGAAQMGLGYYGPVLSWLAQNAGLPGMPANVGTSGIAGQLPPQPLSSGFGSASRGQGAAMRGARGQGPSGVSGLPLGGMFGGQGMTSMLGGQGMASTQPVGGMSYQQALASRMSEPTQAGVLPYSQLGIYGQNPADRYRLQQAEEDIGRMADRQSHQLGYRLGQQGIGQSGIGAAAQAQNQLAATRDLSNFRRNLAINSGQEQQQRIAQLLAALGLGAGAAGNAMAGYGAQQQLAQAGQQGQFSNLLGLASLFGPIKF